MEPEPEPEPEWTHVRGASLGYSFRAGEESPLRVARVQQAERAQALASSERKARVALDSQRRASEHEIVSAELQLSHLQQEMSSLAAASVDMSRARRLAAATKDTQTAEQVFSIDTMMRKRTQTLRGAQSGWMQKLAGGLRLGNPWQRRWFVLDSAQLTYFDDEKKGTMKGAIDLSQCTRVSPSMPAHVHDTERQYEIEVELPKRTYRFRCDSKQDFDHWLRALQKGREDPVFLTATAAKCSVRTQVWLADARDASRRLLLSTVAHMLAVAQSGAQVDKLAVWREGMREWVPLHVLLDQHTSPHSGENSVAKAASATSTVFRAQAQIDSGEATGGFMKVNSTHLGSRGSTAIELKLLNELGRRGASLEQPEGLSIHVSAAEPTDLSILARRLLTGELSQDCSVWTEGMDSWMPIHTLLRTALVVTRRHMPSIADVDRLGEELAHSLDRFVRTRVPVTLHVYDLAHSRALASVNSRALGAFHVAVEVYGYEWSYGWNDEGETGVFACEPKQCEMHTYRESLSMGATSMSREQVNSLLDILEPSWMGEDYHMTVRNCCHFSREFCIGLGVGEIPRWLYRLADAGAAVEEGLDTVAGGLRSIRAKMTNRVGSGPSDE